jgi:Protein of unknown function (DUF4239)
LKWKAISRQLTGLAAWLVAAAFFYRLLRSVGLYDFTASEVEGLNTLILLIGSIYAVMYAFVIYVIWGQFAGVENCVMRECSALRDLLRFSDLLNPDAGRTIRRAVTDYARRAMKPEWDALGDRHQDKATEICFSELVDTVIRTVPASSSEGVIHQRLTDIAQHAGERRDERLIMSLTQIPPTLVRLVRTMSMALILLVFLYPFQHWAAGLFCFVLVALILFFANLVMADTDNPLKGVYNVSARPFSDLLQ